MTLRGYYLVMAGAIVLSWVMYEIGAACPRRHRLVAQQVVQKQPVAQKQAATQKKPAAKGAAESDDGDPAKAAVLSNVRAFTDAYNRRDVMALLKLFTDDCELTEADGTTYQGLKELEEELKATFANDPDGKISVSVDLLRT